MDVPLQKILTERLKLKILRWQIFSLTKIKGVWLKTTHLFCWFEIENSKYHYCPNVNENRINCLPDVVRSIKHALLVLCVALH